MIRGPDGSRPVPENRRVLAATIDNQRLGCQLAGSPLYVDVLEAIAVDVASGGPCLDVLEPHADAPIGDAVLLRLLAGVHELVLGGEAPDLAVHYPSTGGVPGPEVGDVFVRTVGEHVDRLRVEMERGVQTNEVGRSVAVVTGVLALAATSKRDFEPLRVRLLEVGASAGLNLWFDRYRYESGRSGDDEGVGPPSSPVRFRSPWAGATPELDRRFEVVSREGCDRAPIDPSSPHGRRRLRSYVWPDQEERRARLDAAISLVEAEAPVVVAGDAVDWVADRLGRAVPGSVTVLFHTITLQYLAPDERRRFVELVEAAGRRATAGAPLAWLRMEPGGDQADVWLTTWPGGETRRLARSAYHGLPVELVERAASS